MTIATPLALKAEHDELHGELAAATKLPGPVGAAAREVARLLHPHFLKEEEFALPPLGLLSVLAEGAPAGEMLAVTKMTDHLRRELPEMLAEHAAILRAWRVSPLPRTRQATRRASASPTSLPPMRRSKRRSCTRPRFWSASW